MGGGLIPPPWIRQCTQPINSAAVLLISRRSIEGKNEEKKNSCGGGKKAQPIKSKSWRKGKLEQAVAEGGVKKKDGGSFRKNITTWNRVTSND